jgi:exosortase
MTTATVPATQRLDTPVANSLARGAVGSRYAIPLVATAAVLWACWPTFRLFVHLWWTNPQYSHGFLVIPFGIFLLWHRRSLFTPKLRNHAWIGAALLLTGCGLKLIGGFYAFAWPDRISVIFLIVGVFGTLGGWPALKWSWPALCFLVFMVPMPGRMETLLSGPLQRIATVVSANILQTLGFFAQADGTVIILSEADLGIVEACSGLRMLLAFAAMSTAIAIVIDRPQWQKWAILAGTVPIALVCNVGRIVLTAIVLEIAGKWWSDLVFHDLAGWLMMPAGLALLWLELKFLDKLIVPEKSLANPLVAVAPGNTTPPPKLKT